ncbi:fibronectin type III domain-containing protein [Flavobacterium agricola]|uniref:Fibronectin type III domain-containing protein n=1 Tax=Flavobacterium agricola TaxID=2870839 RepID=A0ABY6LZV1_9FLAO|nr:fibronectin type III domain-containing protein [Flavobacterium agricola]UYW01822.1 fibronectin type III domain-containing protein [Flavobacterium agricola]
MHQKTVFIVLFLTLFFCSLSSAQHGAIQVNARAQQDKIMLRWAVNNPIDWQKANTTGFKLNKMLIKKDGVLLANPVKEELTILKAEPLEQWVEFIQKDNYAAIVAQALYGDSFEVGQENEDTLTKIVSISDELNQRFSFALFAADLSFEAAMKAGWGFIDEEVKLNEVYVYQVEAIDLPNINTGAYMLGLSDHEELPKITDFTAIPDDKQIMLSWGIERLNNVYSAYMIERSDEGKDFIPISQTNIVSINTSDLQNNKQMFYGNKIDANNQNYFYRIYGINSFGEKGPYSDIIQTQGVASVVVAPRIIDYSILNSNEVVLEWEFPVEEEKNINAFELHYAQKDLSDYEPVAHHINKSDRKFHYKGLSASNYFKVAVVDQQNNKLFSQSTLVQPIDTIPPSKPLALTGQIDSLGYVKLNWKPNTEKDLAGYRVLRAVCCQKN